MNIYFALLIPIITILILYKYFSRKVVIWEYLLILGVSILFVFLSKLIVDVVSVQSEEYWGSFVKQVHYYEDWDEWIEETCSYECCCDDKGKNCSTITYDCSYRRYHAAYYELQTTNETIAISKNQYLQIKNILGNDNFVELHRDYYRKDGDEHVSYWQNGDSARAIPCTTLHYYENKIKRADQSVFHFESVSDSDAKYYNLKQYPQIYESYKCNALVGDSTVEANLANKKLQYINGLLGHSKQVRCLMFIYKDQPIDAALYQEWQLSGVNMNEFIVCIGINSKTRKVNWCKVLSWTPSEELKARVQTFVVQQNTVDLLATTAYLQNQLQKDWVRRDFTKEFDYLTIEPPTWAVILVFILIAGLNAGLFYYVTTNEYENGNNNRVFNQY